MQYAYASLRWFDFGPCGVSLNGNIPEESYATISQMCRRIYRHLYKIWNAPSSMPPSSWWFFLNQILPILPIFLMNNFNSVRIITQFCSTSEYHTVLVCDQCLRASWWWYDGWMKWWCSIENEKVTILVLVFNENSTHKFHSCLPEQWVVRRNQRTQASNRRRAFVNKFTHFIQSA